VSASRLDPRTVRALVVEDDHDNRTVITRLLRLGGLGPDRIVDIEGDAAAYLRSSGTEVDIVFLDLQMPKKDGYEVLAELRAEPRTASLKVIALTANVMRRDVERCRAAGFDGFIGKPIDGRRFVEVLGRILGGESVWTED
jgi:two-component system cell cycle response regulator DivK